MTTFLTLYGIYRNVSIWNGKSRFSSASATRSNGQTWNGVACDTQCSEMPLTARVTTTTTQKKKKSESFTMCSSPTDRQTPELLIQNNQFQYWRLVAMLIPNRWILYYIQNCCCECNTCAICIFWKPKTFAEGVWNHLYFNSLFKCSLQITTFIYKDLSFIGIYWNCWMETNLKLGIHLRINLLQQNTETHCTHRFTKIIS